MAMLFYGHVRTTRDLDVVVNPTRENLDRVADGLIEERAFLILNPNRPFGARERWALHKGSNATVLTGLGQVDVVQRLAGMPAWAQLAAEAEIYEVDAMRVRVMARRTWIELKRARGSHQDLADIDAVQTLDDL